LQTNYCLKKCAHSDEGKPNLSVQISLVINPLSSSTANHGHIGEGRGCQAEGAAAQNSNKPVVSLAKCHSSSPTNICIFLPETNGLITTTKRTGTNCHANPLSPTSHGLSVLYQEAENMSHGSSRSFFFFFLVLFLFRREGGCERKKEEGGGCLRRSVAQIPETMWLFFTHNISPKSACVGIGLWAGNRRDNKGQGLSPFLPQSWLLYY